jgi:polyisoprenoid-binding protein YceI
MRIKSPVGDFDYRVTAVRLGHEGLEVDGSLGQWQTTMVVEPKELAKAAAVLAVPVALLLSRRR